MLKRLLAAFLLAFSLTTMTDTAEAANPRVIFETTLGSFVVELYPDKAPVTVENFLKYVRAKHYDGTVFHRVIPGFMVQGGGFKPDGNKVGGGTPITNEADNGLRNDAGTIAMARTSDPHSATDQFFINTVDNVPLNHTDQSVRGWGYAVFGKVVKGRDVVGKIETVATANRGPYQNWPTEDVVIKSIRVQSE